ncbi:hypothetical protein [uncultured Tolumonas sp.]|uniref:hypothetical protein n=1 Tax=uncultured Tolumonas sp. TaxID=263765 RepID=UPI002A0A52A9|nr:hypothetical protein [uncultured Tolumonas sp.]
MGKVGKIIIGLAILYTIPKIAFSVQANDEKKKIKATYSEIANTAQKSLPLKIDKNVTLTSVFFDGDNLTKYFIVNNESLLDSSKKDTYQIAAKNETCDANKTITKGDITVHYIYTLISNPEKTLELTVTPDQC